MTQDLTYTRGFTPQNFEHFLTKRAEPEWLVGQRVAAWRVFERLPLPSPQQEDWRRTDLRLFKWNAFSLPEREAEVSLESLSAEGSEFVDPAMPLLDHVLLRQDGSLAGEVLFCGDRTLKHTLSDRWERRGVHFQPLDQAIGSRGAPSLIEKYFADALVDFSRDKFSALAAAAWATGVFLYVPRNVRVEEPFYAASVMLPGSSDLTRSLIILEENSEATLVVETASSPVVKVGPGGLHCGLTEVRVGPGARLRLVTLQNWDQNVWHFAQQRAQVAEQASLQWTVGALGARLAKVDQHVLLTGPDAQAEVNGVMFAEARQHLAYHTRQHHQVGHTKSDLLYKAALQDQSHLVWRGMIRVDQDAQKTDAYQRNDNLILSDHARVDSIPGLEIRAHDVRCTHGATTGRVDDEQVFYAATRGLTPNEAVQVVVLGFFQQVLDRITIDSVREALSAAITRRIRRCL